MSDTCFEYFAISSLPRFNFEETSGDNIWRWLPLRASCCHEEATKFPTCHCSLYLQGTDRLFPHARTVYSLELVKTKSKEYGACETKAT